MKVLLMKRFTTVSMLLIFSLFLFACAGPGSPGNSIKGIMRTVGEPAIERETSLEYRKLESHEDLAGLADGALFLSEDLLPLLSQSSMISSA